MPAAVAGSVREALGAAADTLAAAGVPGPRFDAELLLAAAIGVDRAALAADPGAPVDAPAARAFGAMVRRRIERVPVAYILGRKGFRLIELEVDPRVLIPRPETELLVELALELAPSSVIDVGTGSGAIALALADELPGCRLVATDTSPGAFAVATANATRLGLADRVSFELGTLPAIGHFDLLLANLPYVRRDEWSDLAPEIVRHEPREALLAGEDGLDTIRALIDSLVATPDLRVGAIGLEVGQGQAGEVARLLGRIGYETEMRRDLAGIERCVLGRRA